MDMKQILKVSDWSTCPGGRSRKDGPGSAEEFYEDVLLPKFRTAVGASEVLTVDMDGTAGYAGSWIDEVFGRLGYENNLDMVKYLQIRSAEEPWLEDDIWSAACDWIENGPPDNSPLVKYK